MSPLHSLPLVLALALAPAVSLAQPAQSANASDARFEQGRALRRDRRDAEALEHFRRMHQDTHEARALAQWGLAEAALGRWADAEIHLAEALATPDAWVTANRTAGTNLEHQQQLIASHLGSLEVVCETPGATVWLGERELGALPLARPLRLEAGRVTVEVRAEGHAPTQREVTITSGGLARETVALTRRIATRAGEVAPTPEPVRVGVPRDQSSPGGSTRALAWVAAGGAALFLGGGAVAYALGAPAAERWNDDSQCLRPGLTREEVCGSDGDTARTMGALTVTGLVVGGALAATSAVLFVLASGSRTEARAVSLSCGPEAGAVGLSCVGRF